MGIRKLARVGGLGAALCLAAGVGSGCKLDKKPPPPLGTSGGTGPIVGSGGTDTEDCPAGGCGECELPHSECDAQGGVPWSIAFGLGCDDRQLTSEPLFIGNDTAVGTATLVGTGDIYAPREGEDFAVLGTGRVSDLFGSDRCDAGFGAMYEHDNNLPAPVDVARVGLQTCIEDPTLIGTGDCSNTIWNQYSQAQMSFDYTEIRFASIVPDGATSVKFDFAFMTTEFPMFFGQQFNDMFIGWLESELWTGNISFDTEGNPISLNGSFFTYKDTTAGSLPQFSGTCMAGHAGTSWLTSQAQVRPGEEITMVFAVLDLGDAQYDSFVLLDNFRWGCDEDMMGPSTMEDTDGTTGMPAP